VAEDKEQELRDLQAEESSRGRKHPTSALTRQRQRMLRRISDLLDDRNCDREIYLRTIREFGLKDESPEFGQLLALWRQRRGNG